MLGTLQRMKATGISKERALEWLRQVEAVPVFTAHPTEVARRVVLFKRRRIARELAGLDRLPLTDEEATRRQDSILTEITNLWQTDEVRRRKLKVDDEIRIGLDHMPGPWLPPFPSCTKHLPTTSAACTASLSTPPSFQQYSASAPGSAGIVTATPLSRQHPRATRCSLPAT